MLVVCGGGARGSRLVSLLENALDSVGCFGALTEYISISSVTAAYGFALTYGPSLRLGVPSLRHSSGGIASGRLRVDLLSMCSTASNGAARPPPDERRNEACRGGGWIKIKSCRRANARPVGAAEGCDLLILIFRPFDIVKNQNQKIAAFGSSYRETLSHQYQVGR